MSISLALPLGAAPTGKPRSRQLWLVSPGYDLGFIILSAALLVFPHVSRALIGSNIGVDLVVTMLIGGPHLFATYTMTVMEPDFRARYPRYARMALLLPVLIVSLAALNLTLLVTIFFFWASMHVIHQAAFVADAYRLKDPRGWTWFSRVIDYGLLGTCMYPVATRKLMHGEFVTGGRTLLFPDVFKLDAIPVLLWIVFLGFLTAFVIKTVREARTGMWHGPKTLHMSLATVLFLLTPLLPNLDVAFQGLNTWHSFQYLALVLYLNRLRESRGLIGSAVVRTVSRRGWRLYGLCLAFTLGAGALFFLVLRVVSSLGLFATGGPMSALFFTVTKEQYYFSFYSVILSFLLIHYYFDHFLFLSLDPKLTPRFERLEAA